jgi:hypothetical protein
MRAPPPVRESEVRLAERSRAGRLAVIQMPGLDVAEHDIQGILQLDVIPKHDRPD